MKTLRSLLFIIALTMTCGIYSHEQDMLKESDVSKIMKQILEQHLGKKEFSAKVLNNALIIYINQFDPHRIYLLESEVKPYANMTDQQLNDLIEEYKKSNFAFFHALNKVIQESIERSRRLRRGIEDDARNNLFQINALKENPPVAKKEKELFAKNTSELKNHILENLEEFIESQRQHYSDALIAQRKEETIQAYETQLREFESQYLYVDEKGQPLPAAEQENLFAIHVLKALASSLDAHTSFYQNNEAYDLRVLLQKEFEGLGIVLKDTPQGPTITHLLEGGPAAKNGLIKIGDILIKVDQKPMTDLSFDKVMEILHNPTNMEVKLVFQRKNASSEESTQIPVILKREVIVINNDRVDVSYENFGNGIIGTVKLHSFYQGDEITSEKDVRNAIQKLQEKGNLKGLILDLRDNSGGFLSQAVKVAGLFITNGVVVISKYSDGNEKIYRDVDGRRVYNGPLVILTSKATASAAEIVAQALQDYGVAIVVGDEHTYGKGTIQTQTVTDNQSASYFKVTVGKYYTVSGKTPQKEGVKADIIVPGPWNNKQIGEEFLSGAVSADKISPSYKDDLKDIAPDIKSWYMKYYIPKLQQKKIEWHLLLPTLKTNSEYRIANNKSYQYFLKGDKAKLASNEPDSEEEEMLGVSVKRQKDYGEDDLQQQEAVNIVKDMILLHTYGAIKK
ncbi:MAG: PDZ domain-containing protein [Parachlamydiaceae bacterium]|nr:PDZ domain-containing protein [Parachlamydiaceae bacterium]